MKLVSSGETSTMVLSMAHVLVGGFESTECTLALCLLRIGYNWRESSVSSLTSLKRGSALEAQVQPKGGLHQGDRAERSWML
jgi:hypothetical protein